MYNRSPPSGGSAVWWSVGSGVLAATIAVLVTMMVMFLVLKPDVDRAHERLDVAINDINTQNTRHLKKDVNQDTELMTLAEAITAAEAKLSIPATSVTSVTGGEAAANALLAAVLAELAAV